MALYEKIGSRLNSNREFLIKFDGSVYDYVRKNLLDQRDYYKSKKK